MAHVRIENEVTNGNMGEWRLCFQWCEYFYDDSDETEFGYRFIWRKPNGHLQPARGQARIPSESDLLRLVEMATIAGWFTAFPSPNETEN